MSTDSGVDEAAIQERDALIDSTLAEIQGSGSDSSQGEAGGSGDDKAGDSASSQNETPTGGESATVTPPVTDKAGEASSQQAPSKDSWIDDDVRGMAATLGIPVEKLSGFSTREEFDRALSLVDAAVMRRVQSSQAGADQQQQLTQQAQQESVQRHVEDPNRRPDGTFLPADQRGQDSGQASSVDLGLDPELYEDIFVKDMNRIHGSLASRIDQLESFIGQLQHAENARFQQSYAERFDSIVDSLGHPELFGESGKETPDQFENRKKLFADTSAYIDGLSRSQGRRIRLEKAIVDRAKHISFADHLSSQARQKILTQLRDQSADRMGGSAQSGQEVPYDGLIENNPDLHATFDRLAREG